MGRQVFETACAECHAIRGTTAAGTDGPDLTHLASRRTLGAALLDNTPANLASWIIDPQRHKPGIVMQAANLNETDLTALLAYLQTLN
jgi:cytochrome c oxidase subunit 2